MPPLGSVNQDTLVPEVNGRLLSLYTREMVRVFLYALVPYTKFTWLIVV